MTASSPRWPWIAPIVIYAVSALEMIIMVSPFAAYFYSVYTPVFHGLERSALTAWLPQFFLPHFAQTRFRPLGWLEIVGVALALVGLLGFLGCAVQLYYGKFVKKRLVSDGLYARVRHPQYLCLAVAGAGFLFMWPRFFILATFLMMLGLYYVLAQHEEETIRKRYGASTDAYLASVPMFNPFRSLRSGASWQPPSRGRAFATWLAVTIGAIGLAFLLRMAAVSQLYAVESEAPRVTALSFKARTDEAIGAIKESVLGTPAVQAELQDHPGETLFLQIADGRFALMHLLLDLGMQAPAREALKVPDQGEFVVVSRVLARAGSDVAPDALAVGTHIEPLFLVEPSGSGAAASSRVLAGGDFYPDFSRIRF